ncbi:hypothetical protein ILUMI_13761 [Ignelater luminosus]|uniref:Integrase catalytic domain-containing protein n=1 Tax=Ignelater luminosus TaxID=2038154 RepID=A0A8K0CW52_IGNLU|nr:hypothetical protein ILUMI_13761 [Ignelater luminosus]
MTGKRSRKALYVIAMRVCLPETAARVFVASIQDIVQLWHEFQEEEGFWEGCVYGKQHGNSFNEKKNRPQNVGELVHGDVCGPMQKDSVGGAKYERWELSKKFLNKADTAGHMIKEFLCDEGKEFNNKYVLSGLESKGINLRVVMPYTPEQNGCVERENRTSPITDTTYYESSVFDSPNEEPIKELDLQDGNSNNLIQQNEGLQKSTGKEAMQNRQGLTIFKSSTRHFNLGFDSPATDVCSCCERLKYHIKTVRSALARDLRFHKAKQFNMPMKEEKEGEVTYCFDLQQVQNMPKLPIQETYCSHQIAFYNFCIVDINSQFPHFYVWTENVSGRGSNEVGSALLHFFRTSNFETPTSKIRCFFAMDNDSLNNIKEIEVIFPEGGHSYLPADRVFGRLERELRKQEKIVLPEEYVNIYNKFGQVYELGKNWVVYDLKELLNYNDISMEEPFEGTHTSSDEDYVSESDENRQTNLNLHEVVDSEASVSDLTDSATIAQPSTSYGNAAQQGKKRIRHKGSWKRNKNVRNVPLLGTYLVRIPVDCEMQVSDKLAVTLRFLATGETYRSLMFATRIHESTISLIVPETCKSMINNLQNKYIKMPSNATEWNKIADDFETMWNFPLCVGELDGKHINFRLPSSAGSYFYNYKGAHSIVLLGVCYATYKFIYIDIGVNGRISDGGVYRASLKSGKDQSLFNFPPERCLPGFIGFDDLSADKTSEALFKHIMQVVDKFKFEAKSLAKLMIVLL